MTDLTYKGLQVPWVTRWTNEIPAGINMDLRLEDGELAVGYTEGAEFHDDHGVLWRREGVRRGGEPQFAHVSAFRQRAAMRKGLCQVCGHRIVDRPIRWLMDPDQLKPLDDGTALTVSPPTCSDCVEVALGACPHLRTHDRLILRVLEFRIWGVWGDKLRVTGTRLQRAKGVYVDYNEAELRSIVAKQQVVQLTKYGVEKGPGT